MKHPMMWGFLFVCIIAHFLGVIGSILLPIGFAVVLYITNKQDWTLGECMCLVLFFVFTLMLGLWSLVISLPVILWMTLRTS